MGERRKRKSVLHMEDDNRQFSHPVDHNSWAGKERHLIKNRGRDHEFHGSREFMDPKSRDRLGWPTSESNGENGYCQEIFDGIERRKYKNYPEDDRSDSHRYPRKDRSRSRSRSRSPRGRARSGSPRQDHKNQSHKWSDQRSEPDKQFRICHDFSAGRCRKGSQCRFEHSRNTSRGHSSKDSHGKITGSDLRDDVPSYYHGEERQSLKKSRNAVPCREFLKGLCKWGDSCRFSHHLASDETADAGDPGDDGNSRYDNRLSIGMENEGVSLRTQVGDIGMTGSFDKENIANKQEYNNVLHDFPLQNEVGNVNVQEQHTLLDHGVVENGIVTSFGSDVLDEIKKSDPTHLFPFPGQNHTSENVSVPGQFSVSYVTDVWQNVLSGRLDGPKTLAGAHLDLVDIQSGPRFDLHSQVKDHPLETQSGARLDSHTQVQDDQLETQLEACSYLHSQVNNPQLETQSGVLSDMQAQLPNHEEAVQTLTGLLESKVTFPIGFPQEPISPAENDPVTNEHGNNTEHYNQVQVKQTSPISTIDKGMGNPKVNYSENSKQKQEALSNPVAGKTVGEESKGVEKNKKTDENVASKDEKAMRLFKNSLIEFVKDILKPTWKEGRLSREVHKTIVKKVVDKVTGTVQPYHVPKTQDKVDQYLSFSKPKITKLVQAYVERSQKTDS